MNYLKKLIFEKINHCPQDPLLLKDSFEYENIISWEDIENYLNNPYIHNNDVEVIDTCGIKFNLSKVNYPYCAEPKYLPSQVFNFINNDYSFVLSNMNRYNKELNFLANQIDTEVYGNKSLDFHLYCGLGSKSNSFKAHSDRSYNIIMQVDGTSHWKVYSEIFKESLIFPNSIEKTMNLIIDSILYPGDVLYIPAGSVHKCIPKGKRISISSCWQYIDNSFELTNKSFFESREWFSFKK